MGKHSLPFELVFKRGGDTPAEVRTSHKDRAAAEREAAAEFRRQRAEGWTEVWLAYDLWDHTGSRPRRVVHHKVMQHPA